MTALNSCYLSTIGTANGAYKLYQLELAHTIASILNLNEERADILSNIFKNSLIDYRYSVLKDYVSQLGQFEFFSNASDGLPIPTTSERMAVYNKQAVELAREAAENCFSQITYPKTEITHLITVSCTGMFSSGCDVELLLKLGLPADTERYGINFMGCLASFPALRLAQAICSFDSNAKVLIVSVELSSLHLQKSGSIENLVSASLFSDGAGAMIVEAKKPDKKCISIEHCYSTLATNTLEQMRWSIGDHGFDLYLSGDVPKSIGSGLSNFIATLLKKSNSKLSDVDIFAIHPGGKRILEECEKALNIDHEANHNSYEVLKNFGNMSSATIVFVLKEILTALSKNQNGQKIVSMSFGPGLTMESFSGRVIYP